MKTIKLINSKNGWLCRFIDDERIIKAFGTDTLPTPYFETDSPMRVLKEIQERNPEANVIFG